MWQRLQLLGFVIRLSIRLKFFSGFYKLKMLLRLLILLSLTALVAGCYLLVHSESALSALASGFVIGLSLHRGAAFHTVLNRVRSIESDGAY